MTATAPNNRRFVQDIDYSRFDLLLAAVPIALFSGFLSSVLLPISQVAGLIIGAVTAAGIIAYSMYEIVRYNSSNAEQPHRLGDQARQTAH